MGSNSLKNLLEVAQNKKLPQYLKPEEAELDGVVANLLEKAIGGSKDEALLFRQLLVNSGRFFSLYVFISSSVLRIFLIAFGIRIHLGNHHIHLYLLCPTAPRRESRPNV